MHNTQWPSCQCKCKQNDRQNPFSSRFNVVSQHKAQIKCSLWAISFLTLCRKKWRTAPPKNCRPTVVYRLLRKSSANSQPTVGRLSADCRPTVGSMSVICWPSVGWEPLSNTRKASTHREEHCISTRNETFSLESTILFRFFRDQSPMFRFFRYQTPHNRIASSSQSRSKKFVHSGFLQLFFVALLNRNVIN